MIAADKVASAFRAGMTTETRGAAMAAKQQKAPVFTGAFENHRMVKSGIMLLRSIPLQRGREPRPPLLQQRRPQRPKPLSD